MCMRAMLAWFAALVVSPSHYVVFQVAEVAVSQRLFREILDRIGRLRAGPEWIAVG